MVGSASEMQRRAACFNWQITPQFSSMSAWGWDTFHGGVFKKNDGRGFNHLKT